MKIEIEVPTGKRAEWVNDVLTLVDDKPKDVKERIKTFEDALNIIGEENQLVKEFRGMIAYAAEENCFPSWDMQAFLKLRIICAALNEGWEPKFTKYEKRYYPWFISYTKEEIEKMGEKRKRNIFMLPSNINYGGVACAGADCDSSAVNSGYGSRLAFKNEELAKYAGMQFIDIWADYIFWNK